MFVFLEKYEKYKNVSVGGKKCLVELIYASCGAMYDFTAAANGISKLIKYFQKQ